MNTPLVAIVGPTASGKSNFSMKIAQRFNGEIICADSRTVYKNMDIGTAKPSLADQAKIRHHLLDVVEPDHLFTVADFKRLANEAIEDIASRDKLPLLVGGSGLYVDSILFDYQFGPPAEPTQRTALSAKSVEELQQLCHEQGIELPINSRNKRHLVRALELGGLQKRQNTLRPNTFVAGITTNKEVLQQRIVARAQAMLKAGVIQEAQKLAQQYSWDSEAMKANIYRVFKGVIEGTKTEEAALEEFIQSDVALAKRQLTWFKRDPYIIWGTQDDLEEQIAHFLANKSDH